MKLVIRPNRTILSSTTAVFKTERLLNLTRALSGVDSFLGKLSESIIEHGIAALDAGCYCIRSDSQRFWLTVIKSADKRRDIVFYNYETEDRFIRRGDSRLLEYLKKSTFEAELFKLGYPCDIDTSKLYRLSESNYAVFPLLDNNQSRIVTTEDQNMLVQGVAGSGKTNLCIDKIVYSAGRGYAGKILYSTFSRGLLIDTKAKVTELSAHIKKLLKAIEDGSVIYTDDDKAGAVQNKLGIILDAANNEIPAKLRAMTAYLDNKVEYALIEDLYKQYAGGEPNIADERYFVTKYTQDIKNHQLKGKLDKLNYLSHEVIYKEIFGLIIGGCDPNEPLRRLTLKQYTDRRKESFGTHECEIIYSVAKDYLIHLSKNNLTDNNIMSRELLELGDDLPKYSLTILDEVQDMTEVGLVLFKSISRKMFCVGDALQMINASYFSFAFVKRLQYEKDLSSTAELVSNYRNTKKIAKIAENLSALNAKYFGVHKFVLASKALDNNTQSDTVYVCKSDKWIDMLSREAINNYTIVVANEQTKRQLRTKLAGQEILTVSEIKGLERDTVILYNLLSGNINRWRALEKVSINKKAADENSVYRYYFNLLYVGISRARLRLYVVEGERVGLFDKFFEDNFDTLSESAAFERLLASVDKLEAEQDQILDRIKSFVHLGQYDNALTAANNILAKEERDRELGRIEIHKQLISKGRYRDAGIKFMQLAMYLDAKEQFVLADEGALAELAESCMGQDNTPGLEVLSAWTEVDGNEDVQKIIIELVNQDLADMTAKSKSIDTKAKAIIAAL